MAQQIKEELSQLVHEIKTAKGPARIDMLGQFGLLIPAFASSAVIVLILTFLWYESALIFTSPEGGIGIIVSPAWDPNRDLYGIAIFIAGSFMCTLLAIGIAVPLGMAGALFLSEFCPHRLRGPIRMVIEMMAAIPSIVYGLWAYLVIVPWIGSVLAPAFGLESNGLSLLAGGIILAIMLLPTIVTVSDDALRSVPRTL
ncbi:MAG: PstC family ABC transporter permease, partial [Candidatus Thorarchaeota archaeon]